MCRQSSSSLYLIITATCLYVSRINGQEYTITYWELSDTIMLYSNKISGRGQLNILKLKELKTFKNEFNSICILYGDELFPIIHFVWRPTVKFYIFCYNIGTFTLASGKKKEKILYNTHSNVACTLMAARFFVLLLLEDFFFYFYY